MLLLKCRDRDAHLREAAYEMLAAMPAGSLHAVVKADECRPMLEYGLGFSGKPASIQLIAKVIVLDRFAGAWAGLDRMS